ncbi:uncharacterized protein LOC129222452 [Uloborus diversus]|uniref:uncharacterized protein LOC129222452 n=1 Tax=Uloborus diversus TaxID=327109 RepID=UPI00240A52A5|nr:uncharacterized protein LOC129222452 [Uloborus diversus]
MEVEITRPEGEIATRKRQTSLRRKESFTKKGSRMVIQDCDIMLWRRERALLKLLLCEEEFLNMINLAKERFILPLRKQYALVTPIEIDILFGNIDQVASVHEIYIQKLRQLTQGSDDSIGRLYQNQVEERMAVLKKYLQGLPIAKMLFRYKCCNKLFSRFIEKLNATANIKPREEDTLTKVLNSSEEKIDVMDLMEKPIQYLSELTMHLGMVLHFTAVGHRDYVCLESVISNFHAFSKEMKEVINHNSNLEDFNNYEHAFAEEEPYINLETLQEKIIFAKGPKNFSLVHPGRYWLFCGELSKIEGRHYIQYWALLLSDCFILTRRTEKRVLLVLDEPVMLRSIYQATFDAKYDTEFRILFSLENAQKAPGQRNQWTTWIFRAPTPSIKLLWQTILSYQLSLYSSEALSQKVKSSFVHAKHLPMIIPKKNTKYEESSFMTLTAGPCYSSSAPNTLRKSIFPIYGSNTVIKGNLTGEEDSMKAERTLASSSGNRQQEILREMKSNGSYFSLNEPITTNATVGLRRGFFRSKSYGNDEPIPFIDSTEENNSGTESIIVSEGDEMTFLKDVEPDNVDSKFNEKIDTSTELAYNCSEGDLEDPFAIATNDKSIQTDEPSLVTCARKVSRKRFPRLGTFERIKIDKKISLGSTEVPNTGHPVTGTSSKHRRHVPTTLSKEHLLCSVSPGETESKEICGSTPPVVAHPKRSKSFFARFWKKNAKPNLSKSDSEDGQSSINNCEECAEMERPPDYDTVVELSEKQNKECLKEE